MHARGGRFPQVVENKGSMGDPIRIPPSSFEPANIRHNYLPAIDLRTIRSWPAHVFDHPPADRSETGSPCPKKILAKLLYLPSLPFWCFAEAAKGGSRVA